VVGAAAGVTLVRNVSQCFMATKLFYNIIVACGLHLRLIWVICLVLNLYLIHREHCLHESYWGAFGLRGKERWVTSDVF
jgi:hypothetical protein